MDLDTCHAIGKCHTNAKGDPVCACPFNFAGNCPYTSHAVVGFCIDAVLFCFSSLALPYFLPSGVSCERCADGHVNYPKCTLAPTVTAPPPHEIPPLPEPHHPPLEHRQPEGEGDPEAEVEDETEHPRYLHGQSQDDGSEHDAGALSEIDRNTGCAHRCGRGVCDHSLGVCVCPKYVSGTWCEIDGHAARESV